MRAGALPASAVLLVWLTLWSAGDCAQCPPGDWKHRDGFCYYVSVAQLTWTDALATCRSLGADLASIRDASENIFIATSLNLKGRAWIGYNDRVREGHFGWTDGTAATYSNWRAGRWYTEPNGGRSENCADIAGEGDHFQTWGDWHCSGSGYVHYFVCKMAALAPPVPQLPPDWWRLFSQGAPREAPLFPALE